MSEATGKDAMFFQIILTSMKNKPEVDWAVVAEKAGYKDAKTASTRYGQILKKLTGLTPGQAQAAGAVAGSGAGPSPVKSTPKKAKASATPKEKKEVGSGTNTTPSKVTKRAPKKAKAKAKAKVEVHEDEDEDDEDHDPEPATPSNDVALENGVVESEDFVDAEEDVEG